MSEARWRVVSAPLLGSVLAFVAILAWFWPTLSEILRVWDGSSTYEHGYAVLPLWLWLLWRERHRLLEQGFRPGWLAVLFVLAAGGVWLVGELSAVGALRHFGLAGMLVGGVWLVWGHRAAALAAFPLAFLFFAVPFGEFLVPILMEHTADFTVLALRLSGIPVYREGLSFVIPSGHWSVVEACSGIRYLIASLMVGSLYAYLTYASLGRRLAFVAFSFVMPLVANWLRAYLIVMLGHLSGNKLAVGVDHLIYGWLFFGLVVFAMFWIGARWRQPVPQDAPPSGRVGPVATARAFALAVLLAVAAAALWKPLAQWMLNAPMPSVAELQAPVAGAGWQWTETPANGWQPTYAGMASSLIQSYRKGDDRVQVFVYAYAGQRDGHKLLQWDNRLIATDESERPWEVVAHGTVAADLGAGEQRVERARIRGRNGSYVETWHWLVVDERPTISVRQAKLSLLRDRLLRQSDYSAAVFVATDADETRARAVLRDFLQAHGRAIGEAVAAAER